MCTGHQDTMTSSVFAEKTTKDRKEAEQPFENMPETKNDDLSSTNIRHLHHIPPPPQRVKGCSFNSKRKCGGAVFDEKRSCSTSSSSSSSSSSSLSSSRHIGLPIPARPMLWLTVAVIGLLGTGVEGHYEHVCTIGTR